jgi:hypothetical protein
MKLSDKDVNQAKVDPDSDRGINLTVSGPCVDICPHYMGYRLTCSTVETLSLT